VVRPGLCRRDQDDPLAVPEALEQQVRYHEGRVRAQGVGDEDEALEFRGGGSRGRRKAS